MKAQSFNKNGFPKPLGIILIIITISLICFAQCLFAQAADAQTTGVKFDFLGVDEEPEVRVEDWMIDNSYWNKGNTSYFLVDESEPEIAIEYWMTDFSASENDLTVSDPEVKIEIWMYDNKYWLVSESTNYALNEGLKEEIKIEE
jgi:hypothetical protein